MKKFEIEIERNNVTPAQFLSYVRSRVDAKGGKWLRGDLDLSYFKAGNDLNFNIYHENGCHEISISKPYEMQSCIINADGSRYNEICEFTFDETGKTGSGYYYLINVEAEEEAAEAEEAKPEQPEQPEKAAEAEEEEEETMKSQNETITLYGTEVDRAELAETLKQAELESLRNARIDLCITLDLETGEMSIGYYEPGWTTERERDGLEKVIYTTHNRYFHAFSDLLANGTPDQELNDFAREVVSQEAWKTATEDADGDPAIWNYIPSGWNNELDNAVIDQYGEIAIDAFDPDQAIDEIKRQETEYRKLEEESQKYNDWQKIGYTL